MTDLPSPTPAAIVQAQLDAYNAHDVPALLAIYADDAQQFQHPDTLLATGGAQIGPRFMAVSPPASHGRSCSTASLAASW